MTTAIATSLTPAQLEEAKRVFAAQAEANVRAQNNAMYARLFDTANAALPEVLAQPGVLRAQVVKEGYYVNAIGIRMWFARPSGKGEIDGWLTFKIDGYHAGAPMKMSTKVKAGYKSGYRTFKSVKSVKSAVKGSRAFVLGIAASVDDYMAKNPVAVPLK